MHEYRDSCETCSYNYEGGVIDGLYWLHRTLMAAWMQAAPLVSADQMMSIYNEVWMDIIERQKRAYAETQKVIE